MIVNAKFYFHHKKTLNSSTMGRTGKKGMEHPWKPLWVIGKCIFLLQFSTMESAHWDIPQVPWEASASFGGLSQSKRRFESTDMRNMTITNTKTKSCGKPSAIKLAFGIFLDMVYGIESTTVVPPNHVCCSLTPLAIDTYLIKWFMNPISQRYYIPHTLVCTLH